MDTGLFTKGRLNGNQAVSKARLGLSLDSFTWSVLGPRIEDAEAAQDLPALRALERDIRSLISGLVLVGLYHVQELILTVADATGQELTGEEEERKANKQAIDFARALDDEDMLNLYERTRNFVLNWMDVNKVPAEIRTLFDELPLLYHGGITLWTHQELTDGDAYCLADSYRKTMLSMASMRRAGRAKNGVPAAPAPGGKLPRRPMVDAEALMCDLEVFRQEWAQATGGLQAETVDLASLFDDIEELVSKRTS